MTGRTVVVAQVGTRTESCWVTGMREHFAQTGQYRSEDVRKLLGNPWDRVEVLDGNGVRLVSGIVK